MLAGRDLPSLGGVLPDRLENEVQYRFNRRYDLAAMLPRLLQAMALRLPRPIPRSSVTQPELADRHHAAPTSRVQRRIGEARQPGETAQGARSRATSHPSLLRTLSSFA